MVRGPGPFDDPDNYLPLARSLAAGDGFMLKGRPTAYRPPLYPLMLAPLISHGGDRAVLGIALLAPRPGGRHRMADSGRGQRFGLVTRASRDRRLWSRHAIRCWSGRAAR